MALEVLLLGRTAFVLDDVEAALDPNEFTLHAGTSLPDVERIMADRSIDAVIMGAGLDIETRLAIIKHVFDVSTSTTVHMKDWDSGPGGMVPFVNAVISGLTR